MIRLQACLTGRLGAAYPAAEHDVELQVSGVAFNDLAAVLSQESDKVLAADPRCRKVVFAAPAGDLRAVAAAEVAGFRFVVDVDIADGPAGITQLSLMVREPEWVTTVDMDLDHVPES